jgi:hypothetical protein
METNKQMRSKLGIAAIALSAVVGGMAGLIPGLAATDTVVSIVGGSLFGCIVGTLAFISISTISHTISTCPNLSIGSNGASSRSNTFLVAAMAGLSGILSALTTTTVFKEPNQGYIALAVGCSVNFLAILFITFVLIKRTPV